MSETLEYRNVLCSNPSPPPTSACCWILKFVLQTLFGLNQPSAMSWMGSCSFTASLPLCCSSEKSFPLNLRKWLKIKAAFTRSLRDQRMPILMRFLNHQKENKRLERKRKPSRPNLRRRRKIRARASHLHLCPPADVLHGHSWLKRQHCSPQPRWLAD